MALQDLWLEGIDVDAALYDIRDDDTQAWEVRALAGASIGIDPIAGLRAVIELSTAMERIVRGENDGKAQLASIIDRAGDDYQRCLWYTRSEERRVGKECVSTCSSGWSTYH